MRGLVRNQTQARVTLARCLKAAGLPLSRMPEFVVGDLAALDKQFEGLLLAAMRDTAIVLHCAGLAEGWQADPRQWDRVNRGGASVLM